MNLMLYGSIGTGKSEASNYLADRYGAIVFQRTRLMRSICHALVDGADDLDELLRSLFPEDEQAVADLRSDLVYFVRAYVPDASRQRQLYQHVVDIVQQRDPVAFEVELMGRIDLARQRAGADRMIVVEDIYTLPAYEFFAARGFRGARITAPASLARKRVLARDGFLPVEGTFDHETERDLEQMPFAMSLANDGTIDHLRRQLDTLVQVAGAADGPA
jgi:dephospho-CoA kinase